MHEFKEFCVLMARKYSYRASKPLTERPVMVLDRHPVSTGSEDLRPWIRLGLQPTDAGKNYTNPFNRFV